MKVAGEGAIFVVHRNSLHGGVGGQQLCTREYLRVLEGACGEVEILEYEHQRSLAARIRGRIFKPNGYPFSWEKELPERVRAAHRARPEVPVFLNLNDLLPLGPLLRATEGKKLSMVLLAHGLRSVEAYHHQRIGKLPGLTTSVESRANLARLQREEGLCLPAFDLVVNLAPFEVEICRWLGARRACWLPRIVEPDPIPWKPVGGRLGVIGTMNHAPNAEGLLRWLEALQPMAPVDLRVRIISHSSAFCRHVSDRFQCVDYLGPLSETEARAEAGSWSAFVHPQFCYAMGCSTKLATGLSWGVPCLTTPAGSRGYKLAVDAGVVLEGDEHDLALACVEQAMSDSPKGLCQAAVQCSGESVAAMLGVDLLDACRERRQNVEMQ